MSTRKTVTEVIASEKIPGPGSGWREVSKTVTTVTETIERDDEGYTWTPRVPRYSTAFLDGRIGFFPDFSDRLINRTRKDTNDK